MAAATYSDRIFWMARLVREAEARQDEALARYDITAAQWRALSVVVEGRADTIRGIAAALQVDGAAATRLVDRLQAKAYVAREPDPRDRRSVRVVATRPGRHLADDVSAAARQAEDAFFGTLPVRHLKGIDRGMAALAVTHGLGRITKSGNLRPPKRAR